MDVVLFAASGGLGSCLPISSSRDASSKSVRIALGLSLALFSLSILEICPSQWLVLLQPQDGGMTIAVAYEIILWLFCIGIVLILPAGIGRQIFQMTTAAARKNKEEDDADDKTKKQRRKRPWWIRYSWQFFLLVLSICYRVCLSPLVRLIQRQRQRYSNSELPTLVLAASQDGSTPKTSSRHGGPKTPTSGMAATLSSNVLGGIGGVITTLVLLQTLGSLVIPTTAFDAPILSIVVSWLCAVGLVLSSTLNGFGSVSLPYSCLAGLFLQPLAPQVVTRAELEYKRTRQALDTKLMELHGGDSTASLDIPPSAGGRRRSTHNKFTFADFNSDESSKRKQVLQTEIDFLDTLLGELKEDIVEMKYAQIQAAKARTTVGKIRSYIGFVFSIMLLIRLYMASRSILQESMGPRPERGDPITTALLWLTTSADHDSLVSNHDYNTLSQAISLLLTAVLSASQINTFLRTVAAVNRRILLMYRKCYCAPSTRNQSAAVGNDEHWDGNSSYHQIHSRVLAALTGCYFLSCVVLTKMNVPLQYRSSFSAALGGMEYSIRTPVVNFVFCISAGVSAMVLGLLFGIQRQNTKRHADEIAIIGGGSSGVGMDVC
jgi:hypothetical protein